MFHPWSHSPNSVRKIEVQLDWLGKILKDGDRLRQKGKLRRPTMADMAGGDSSGARAG